MAFLDTLRKRNEVLGQPAGATYGNEMYYGQPPIAGVGGFNNGPTYLDLSNEAVMEKNRDANRANSDFAYRTRVANDEAIRAENMRKIFDPNQLNFGRGMNVQYQPSIQEQGQITPIDKAKIDLEREKIQTVGGLDKAEFGLKNKQYELDKLKNEQIYGTKSADMERKSEEAEKRLRLAYDQLQARQGDASATAAYHQAQLAAQQARMELMATQHKSDLDETRRIHDAQMKKMRDDLDLATNSETKTVVDENGQEKTVTTRKGTVPVKKSEREGYVRVIDPTGRHGDWPANKPLPKGFTHIGQ